MFVVVSSFSASFADIEEKNLNNWINELNRVCQLLQSNVEKKRTIETANARYWFYWMFLCCKQIERKSNLSMHFSYAWARVDVTIDLIWVAFRFAFFRHFDLVRDSSVVQCTRRENMFQTHFHLRSFLPRLLLKLFLSLSLEWNSTKINSMLHFDCFFPNFLFSLHTRELKRVDRNAPFCNCFFAFPFSTFDQ